MNSTLNLKAHECTVLLSGGLDSAACVNFYKDQGCKVSAIHFSYGQVAESNELDAACRVTAIHFGKSLGLPLVKPDRHLVRIANEHGFECPSDMCACIAKIVGDPLQVIDIVLWRYGAIRSSRRASHRSPIEESVELGDMA